MEETIIETEPVQEKVFGKRIPIDVDSAGSKQSGASEKPDEHPVQSLAHTSLSFGDIVYSFLFKKPMSITGDWIYRDVKVFIPETVSYGLAVFMGITIFAIMSLLDYFWLAEFQKKASEEAYVEVATHIGQLTQAHALAWGLLIVVVVLFFLFKTFILMPNKHKVPVLRAFRGGLLRPSVDTFKHNEMKFWGNPVGDKINVQEPREHVDWNTGLPYLILVEGKGTNKSIIRDERTDLTSIEWDSVISSAVSTQASIDEWKFAKKQEGFGINPMLFVIGAVILLLLIGGFILMNPQKAPEAVPVAKNAATMAVSGLSGVMF